MFRSPAEDRSAVNGVLVPVSAVTTPLVENVDFVRVGRVVEMAVAPPRGASVQFSYDDSCFQARRALTTQAAARDEPIDVGAIRGTLIVAGPVVVPSSTPSPLAARCVVCGAGERVERTMGDRSPKDRDKSKKQDAAQKGKAAEDAAAKQVRVAPTPPGKGKGK